MLNQPEHQLDVFGTVLLMAGPIRAPMVGHPPEPRWEVFRIRGELPPGPGAIARSECFGFCKGDSHRSRGNVGISRALGEIPRGSWKEGEACFWLFHAFHSPGALRHPQYPPLVS
jgi:hypothetical protein